MNIRTFRLAFLPPDTKLEVIIELINGMKLHLTPDDPDVANFIRDHPELVDEIL